MFINLAEAFRSVGVVLAMRPHKDLKHFVSELTHAGDKYREALRFETEQMLMDEWVLEDKKLMQAAGFKNKFISDHLRSL